jgi:hypothetical protein
MRRSTGGRLMKSSSVTDTPRARAGFFKIGSAV